VPRLTKVTKVTKVPGVILKMLLFIFFNFKYSKLLLYVNRNIKDNSYISSSDIKMMTGNILGHSKRLIFCLLIICFNSTVLLSQQNLSGDISINNPSTHVLTIGLDRVTVKDVTGFSPNDTILLIQMQGAKILTTSSYGTIQNKLGEPGMHEFMIIQSINGGTKEIVFFRNILKTYDPKGNIQIVRVPYYNSATITGKLFCTQWDTVAKSGGVLALIIGRTLTLNLNADIDVSGLGFNGGKDTIGAGICVTTNLSLYDHSYYPRSFKNAGVKGEGVANYSQDLNQPLDTNFMKGFGANWTGGGGGNGRYSGGGGGSNRGGGGTGGYEDGICPPYPGGGTGGVKADFLSLTDRIYMGGGGGASTTALAVTSSFGGNGGGIVIIVADGIASNGGKIISNGGNGGSATGAGGSGGGGAGGSIALSLNSFGLNPLNFSALGGTGGDNPVNGYGEGGGGGGGLLSISSASMPGNVFPSLNGGTSGLNPGASGETRFGFKAILNGFLFNAISSSITGNQDDSICSNVTPKLLIGTIPVGGSGSYTFKWQKSHNILDPADTTDILSNTVNYLPTDLELTTVYFRRIVTDNISFLRDISKWVKIIVQPAITSNNIGKDTTICSGQDPLPIGSVPVNSTPSNGNGIYRYKWLQNLTNSSWDTLQVATGPIINGKGYDPPSLTQTTYYRRYVQSGRCVDTSPTVTINVLPNITGNSIIRSDSVICEGSIFPDLGATAPGGGNLSYIYQWQDSVSTWSPASGINPNTNNTYSVDTSKFPIVNNEKRYFRRVVFSGPLNTCQSKSVPILLTRFHKIKNNSIQSDQTICSGDVPLALSGVTASPTGGTGTYSFLWEQSPDGTASWTNAIGTDNATNYGPPALTTPAWYRRTVYSGIYKSLPVCTNTSPSVAISVQPSIINNSISILGSGPDTTICSGQKPNQIQKIGSPLGGGNGIYTLQWAASSSSTGSYTDISGANGLAFTEAALTSSEYYKLKVVSDKCTSESNIVTVNVLPVISGFNIEKDQSICKNQSLPPINSVAPGPSGGNGTFRYKWQQNIANGGWTDVSPNGTSSAYSKSSISDPTQYKRYIYSGLRDCCQDTSNIVSISILSIPALPDPGPDTTIYSIGKIYKMKAAPPLPGETGAWTTVSGEGKTDDNSYNTFARELNGSTTFLWTITKGTCTLDSTVVITLNDDNKSIPQGFSPNYDTINDVFKIKGLFKNDETIQLSIVNGAGTEVFSTYSANGDTSRWKDWDGKNSAGAELSEGTYYYILKVTTSKGYVSRKSGFIVLKRY